MVHKQEARLDLVLVSTTVDGGDDLVAHKLLLH
jgi:hypothetical protein